MTGHRTELTGYDAMVGLARRLSLDTASAGPSAPVAREPLDPSGPTGFAGPAAPKAEPSGAIGEEQVA
jgi:hypothetical protein